jgi:hypothetical protein
MGILSVAVLIVLAVLTVAPLLMMSDADLVALHKWYRELSMTSQSLFYALLRLFSYPNMSVLQDALARQHGYTGSILVLFIGETLGSAMQLSIFECVRHFGRVTVFRPAIPSAVAFKFIARTDAQPVGNTAAFMLKRPETT